MHTHKEKKRAERHKIFYFALGAVAALLLTLLTLKSVYLYKDSVPLINQGIQNLILNLFHAIPLGNLFWGLLPDMNPNKLIASGNLAFIFLFGLILFSAAMRKNMSRKLSEIHQAEENVRIRNYENGIQK